MPVAIAYPPGAYGTYLDWCLTTLSSTDPIVAPFASNGTSHQFKGNHLLSIDLWATSKAPCGDFFRLHPKYSKNDSVVNSALRLIEKSNHVIMLYPTKDTTLLCLNNLFFKVTANHWEYFFAKSVDPSVIYNNWPVSKDTKFKDVSPWIQREFFSFYLMPFWDSLVSQDAIENFKHPQCLNVTVQDLLTDFEATLWKIKTTFRLTFKREIEELLPYHQQNLQLQKYLTHDELCKSIIDSAIGGTELTWEPIGICSESYIQWELRNRGLELRCNGLDNFPTSSIQLRELLYPV